jgi:hypothetical protein
MNYDCNATLFIKKRITNYYFFSTFANDKSKTESKSVQHHHSSQKYCQPA